MKKFTRKEFQDKIIGYYGARKKKSLSGQKGKITARHFDDGTVTAISYGHGLQDEYEVRSKDVHNGTAAGNGNGWLTEYEVVSPGKRMVSGQQSFNNNFFVEPFEDSSPGTAGQPSGVAGKEDCQCNAHQQPAGNKNNPATEAAEAAKKLQEDALQNIPSPEIPSVSFGKSTDKVTDDDFLADMKSILSGAKVFDPSAKKIVNKNSAKNDQQSKQQSRSQSEEEIKPLENKNEHRIFDKIAESMKYANAYDLGSFAVEQRFDDFDKLDDIKVKAKERKPATPVSRSSSVILPPKDRADVTSEDFVSDMDLIAGQQSKSNNTVGNRSYAKEIPLDPGAGGQSIGLSAMQPGDIIISTTDADISKKIRQATGSQVSHASVYIGDGNVIEAVDSGVLQFTVATSIEGDSVAVAYRHRDMTPEKARSVITFLKQAKSQGKKFDFMGLIRVAPYQIVSNYCDTLPEAVRGACRAAAGTFKLGTDNNNEFYCSELVFEALKQAGLNISDVDPHWSSPQDVVRLNHNNALHYVGHLKA